MQKLETFGLLSDHELELFELAYFDVVETILEKFKKDVESSHLVTNFLTKLLDYNVPNGKRLRGLMGLAAYKCLSTDASEEGFKLACAGAWAGEMFQAACLIADDVMDRSETRRGQVCWYKVPGVGMTAVNGAFMLEQLAFLTLRVYFSDKSYYNLMMENVRAVCLKTVIGQGMDLQTERLTNFSEKFTMERYSAIVKYKTSYYTVYSPIMAAIIMIGRGEDKELISIMEDLTLKFGHYFQVQDDFLDCYGDETITGKMGTDIQDNKCTWLIVTAIQMCTDKQLEILKTNYGRDDVNCVKKVKAVYKELDIVGKYKMYEDDTYDCLAEKIENLPADMPQDIFLSVLGFLYKRRK